MTRTLQNGGDERSGVGLLVVDVGAVLDQQLHHLQVGRRAGKVERLVSATCGRTGIIVITPVSEPISRSPQRMQSVLGASKATTHHRG
jgi:hypothetical protein